jgi:hypothetical protein
VVYAGGTLTLTAVHLDFTMTYTLDIPGDYGADTLEIGAAGLSQAVVLSPPCFAAGTRIATPRGEVAVEALGIGDTVTLASGGTAPIIWIGRRRVDCASHPKPRQVRPVCIRAMRSDPASRIATCFCRPITRSSRRMS